MQTKTENKTKSYFLTRSQLTRVKEVANAFLNSKGWKRFSATSELEPTEEQNWFYTPNQSESQLLFGIHIKENIWTMPTYPDRNTLDYVVIFQGVDPITQENGSISIDDIELEDLIAKLPIILNRLIEIAEKNQFTVEL